LPSPLTSRMIARMSAIPFGSRPFAGSSRMRSSGSLSSAAATSSRCFIPSEYFLNLSPALLESSTCCKTSSTREGATPEYRAITRKLSLPERYG